MIKLTKSDRKELLQKISKPLSNELSGKHNRKSLEKFLSKNTSNYNDLKKTLSKEKADFEKLKEEILTHESELRECRQDIIKCHDVLRNMDFSGASEVKIGKDDIAYACDGKWVHYNSESGEQHPYSKWKKEKSLGKENKAEDAEDAENADSNDINVEGVDITL